MNIEQIDIGRMLCSIDSAESIMYVLFDRTEDKNELISKIIYNYVKKDLDSIGTEIHNKYGYNDARDNYFILNKCCIKYDNEVVYKINVQDKLEDILSDFYTHRNDIIKKCDKKFGSVIEYSKKYNDFVTGLLPIIQNDMANTLNRKFTIISDNPYWSKTYTDDRSTIYTTRCKRNIIVYAGLKMEIDYNQFNCNLSPDNYWERYKGTLLSELADNMLSTIAFFESKFSLKEQKFIINTCSKSKRYRIKSIFSDYKHSCAATNKYLKDNIKAFTKVNCVLPEFK